MDPFALTSNACIPDLIDRPSLKLRSVIRGTCTAGTSGFGFLLLAPLGGIASTSITAIATTATYTLSSIQGMGTTGVAAIYNTQCPYTQSDIPAQVAYRVVACGMRLRYIGTELNRGGRYVCHRLPSTQNYLNYTSAEILARSDAISTQVDRRWHGVTHVPTSDEDYQYKNGAIGLPGGGLTVDNGSQVVVFESNPGNQFEFEIVYYHEFVPGTTRTYGGVPGASPSHSDVPGLSAIRNVIQDKIVEPGPSAFMTALNWLQENTVATMSSLATAAIKNPQAARAIYNAAPLLLNL